MSGVNVATAGASTAKIDFPFRWTIVVVQSLVALGGLAGSIQLLAGLATPPVSVISPLGLSSWALPAAWLFSTVALPSALAAWLAWRRSPRAPAPFCWRVHCWRLSCLCRFRFLDSVSCN